jgi:hypothetical protein
VNKSTPTCFTLSIEEWRGDARYPAMIVKVLNQHLESFIFNQSLAGMGWTEEGAARASLVAILLC